MTKKKILNLYKNFNNKALFLGGEHLALNNENQIKPNFINALFKHGFMLFFINQL